MLLLPWFSIVQECDCVVLGKLIDYDMKKKIIA